MQTTIVEDPIGRQGRFYIIASALLALFLGAMDALVMTAAAPTIIADLGGLHLYSWVYSAYFLARAVALPVFGKLADLFNTRKLFLFAISLFLCASIAAGASRSMAFLVFARVFQGIGAGACFALVYIVLSEVAAPGARARTLSLASSVWGISSIIGPTLGGVIVTWFSWRWIFYINVPLGIISLVGIGRYLSEFREKKKTVELDYAGVVCLTGFILGFISLFMTGGKAHGGGAVEMGLMLCTTVAFGVAFIMAEHRAKDPILDLRFFRNSRFSLGNGATFFASCTIFALFAYAPLFIQGALNQTPMQVGMAMLSLSLGWSVGAMAIGRIMDRTGGRTISVMGGLFMVVGAVFVLNFSLDTTAAQLFWVFMVVGLGMGFVSLSTMVQVQKSLPEIHLGVATASSQFARTLGGTIGVGVCGGLVTSGLVGRLEKVSHGFPAVLLDQLREGSENLFRPEVQALIPDHARQAVQSAVLDGVHGVFIFVLISAVICLVCSVLLARSLKTDAVPHYPRRNKTKPVPTHHIAVGVVKKGDRLLITRRKQEGVLGGLWEFPGGKVEKGETPEAACIRELLEETGLVVSVDSHLTRITHAYTHFRIKMDVYCCHYVANRVKLNGPVDHRWIFPSEIERYPFPKANLKFIHLLIDTLKIKQGG